MIGSSKKRFDKESFKLNMGQASRLNKNFNNYLKTPLRKIPKQVKKVALILICSFLFVLIFFNREKLSPDYVGVFFQDAFAQAQHGPGYPYRICGNRVDYENFQTLGKGLFVLSDTSFVSLNGSAKEINNQQHCYHSPILKSCNNRAIFYDLGGKQLKVCSKSKVLHAAQVENNIISADVCERGIYGVITETKGFLGQLTVFSKDGNDIYYRYNFADHYITDIAISDNGKYTAVCGCTTKDASMVSSVYVFDYNSETPILKFDYNDNMFIKINYLSNGNIVAIGDNLTTVINPKKQTRQDYNYVGKSLLSYDVNRQEGVLLALSLSEDGNNADMVLINKRGKEEGLIHTKHNIKSVSLANRRLAALSYGNVYIYSLSGEELKVIEAGNDVKKVSLTASNTAYVLGVTEIRKLTF